MSDVIYIPDSTKTPHIHSIICQSPKGASDHLANVSYYGDSVTQPTGVFAHLDQRYYHGQIVSIGQ